jgi:outer membrane protein OmpA-like peptidoglycan-associated protein
MASPTEPAAKMIIVRLSQARADSLARELARNGFDRARIITHGFAKETLRV